MNALVNSYARALTPDNRLRVINDEFKHDFPDLALCLCGVLTEDGKSLALPACKLTLWADAGNLSVCLNPSVGNRKAFLSLGDGLASWAVALNELLSQGIRWAEPSGQKTR
jgi:hypothetical protein